MSSSAPPSSTLRSNPEGLAAPQRYWAATVQLSSILMSVIDASIANVALPTIAGALDASPADAVWVVNAYNVVLLVALLPLSALGDRIGFRKVYTAGLAVFTLASLCCALSSSLTMLTMARVLQGLGAAAMMSVMAGMMRHIYPLHLLGRGIGLNAMVVGSGSALGPTISSLVLSVADWPWLFAINIPIGIAALLAYRLLPESRPVRTRFDALNAVLSGVMLVLLVIGLDQLAAAPLSALAAMAVGVGLGVVIFRRARKQTAPLWPIDLFPIRAFSFGISSWLFMFAAQTAAFIALPFYFLQTFGRDQIEVGLLMTAWPVCSVLVAPLAGRLADRYRAAVLCLVGSGLLLLGHLLLLSLPAHAGDAAIVGALMVCGVGFGFFHSPNNRSMIGAIPIQRVGAAGGLQSTSRTFGQSVGAALVAISFGLSAAYGPFFALIMASACTLVVVAINLVQWRGDRRLERAP